MFTEDFVNREKQLDLLWQVIQQEADVRIILIAGPSGIGKTYLLEECCSRCGQHGILHVRIDFTEQWNSGYLAIIRNIRHQLGSENFGHFDQVLMAMRTLGKSEPLPEFSSPPGTGARPGTSSDLPGRSGGVNLSGPTKARDVVGRDINYITQIIQTDDALVQNEIRDQLIMALQQCVQQLTTRLPVVFFFDSWERATTDDRIWIHQHMLDWILEKRFAQAVAIVAGIQPPQLQRLPRRVAQMSLSVLPDDALQTYWLEKRGLSPQELPHIIRLTRGHPAVVAMLADMQMTPLQL